MPDGWGTAFARDFFARQTPLDGAAHFAALVGQRQAERQLQAVIVNEEYLIEQNALLCQDLNQFMAYGQDVAARNQALCEYVDRLSQEIASLRGNEDRFLQEATNLRDYNSRLCQENEAWRRYSDRIEQENADLKTQVDDLMEEDGQTD